MALALVGVQIAKGRVADPKRSFIRLDLTHRLLWPTKGQKPFIVRDLTSTSDKVFSFVTDLPLSRVNCCWPQKISFVGQSYHTTRSVCANLNAPTVSRDPHCNTGTLLSRTPRDSGSKISCESSPRQGRSPTNKHRTELSQ